MKTYSLFIIKPGFIQSFAKIKDVMGKNNIKVVTEYKGKLEKDVLAKHYAEHFGKPFYNKLIEYMSDGKIGDVQFDSKVVVMVVSSAIKNESEQDFITRSRKVVKEILRPEFELNKQNLGDHIKNPNILKNIKDEDLKEVFMTANVIHASDSPESAKREIGNMAYLFSKNDEEVL